MDKYGTPVRVPLELVVVGVTKKKYRSHQFLCGKTNLYFVSVTVHSVCIEWSSLSLTSMQ